MFRILPLLLLMGCGQNRGFGGQDLGGVTDDSDPMNQTTGETTADSGGTTDTSYQMMDNAFCGDTGTNLPPMSATGGVGEIAVQHRGAMADCCAEWRFSPVTGNGIIDVTYVNVSDTECECECPWTFEYTLTDIPAGDWKVRAGYDEVSVRVD